MKQHPKVSIITVSHNSGQTIEDTIKSVCEQTYRNIEHIVIDGGSTDGTLDIIERYKTHLAKYTSEPDEGIYYAMNKGLGEATGDIIGFLNSDDFYANEHVIADIVNEFCAAGVDSVFGDLVMVSVEDTSRVVRYYRSSRFSPAQFRYGWMPAHPTFFATKRCYDKFGGYKTDYRISADYELLVRFLGRNQISYSYIGKVLVKMRVGGVSTRGWKSRWILNKEIVRACRENGIDTSLARLFLKIPKKVLEYWRKPDHRVAGE